MLGRSEVSDGVDRQEASVIKERATRIALVDDDLSVRRGLARLLRSAGYDAQAFASAKALFDSGYGQSTDCFVIDLHLDGESGFDLLNRLRSEGMNAPAILITGFDSAANRDRAGRLGASAFLAKPFDVSALLDAVAEAVEEGRRGGA